MAALQSISYAGKSFTIPVGGSGGISAASLAEVAESPATKAYAAGDYITMDNVLYKVTSDIAVDDEIEPDTNVEAVSVMEELETALAAQTAKITELTEKLAEYGDVRLTLTGDDDSKTAYDLLGKLYVPGPGAYDANGEPLKTWAELIEDGDIVVNSGTDTMGSYTLMTMPTDKATRMAGVETFVVEEGVTAVGTAFQGLTDLKHVVLPSTINGIAENAFDGCTSLEEIDLSETKATWIDENAFRNCSSLKWAKLCNTATTVIRYVFVNCPALEEVYIPASVREINSYAFVNCPNLTKIYYSGTATGAPWGAENATVISE